MTNIALVKPTTKPELQSGAEPPDNGAMEARVLKLEDFAVETRDRLMRIESTMATKTDVADLKTEMHKGFGDLLKWMVGMGFIGMAAMITIMTFVLNNAVPKAVQQAQPAPIIINVPAPVAAAPVAPPK